MRNYHALTRNCPCRCFANYLLRRVSGAQHRFQGWISLVEVLIKDFNGSDKEGEGWSVLIKVCLMDAARYTPG